MTYELITVAKFQSTVTALGNNLSKSKIILHNLAVSAVFHSIKDGQITPAKQLVTMLKEKGQHIRANDLQTWMVKHGNLKYSKEKGLEYRKQFEHGEEIAYVQCETLVPFWEEVKEQAVKTEIDALSLLRSAVNRIKTEMKKAADEGRSLNVKHGDALSDMETLLSKYGISA